MHILSINQGNCCFKIVNLQDLNNLLEMSDRLNVVKFLLGIEIELQLWYCGAVTKFNANVLLACLSNSLLNIGNSKRWTQTVRNKPCNIIRARMFACCAVGIFNVLRYTFKVNLCKRIIDFKYRRRVSIHKEPNVQVRLCLLILLKVLAWRNWKVLVEDILSDEIVQ